MSNINYNKYNIIEVLVAKHMKYNYSL